MIGEFELIKEIKRSLSYKKDVIKGIGDDCAVVKSKKGFLLYTIDNMIQDIHFNLSLGTSYKNIGYKAVVRAISDIAAMGGKPLHILVSLAISNKVDNNGFKDILSGIKRACKVCNTDLIGGDITKSKIIALTVAVVGESNTAPVLRSGAEMGDSIYITGELGLARAGLELLKQNKRDRGKLVSAYEKPVTRLDLGYALRTEKIAKSMIDISDGLLGDLMHILEESKKGALLDINNLPIPDILLQNFSQEDCFDFVTNGGDDYELIFTAEQRFSQKVSELSRRFKIPITKIGKIVEKGFYFLDGTKKIKITPFSYQHRFSKI